MSHITVLLEEAVSALNLSTDSVAVDCTLGAGGHARQILSHLGTTGRYIGFDADSTAIEGFGPVPANAELVHANFAEITKELLSRNVTSADAILADLGWRSEQFESGNKGFSFKHDEPLLMTFGEADSRPFTAADIVNTWDESSIADVVYGYGEERAARKIARAIVQARQQERIVTSGQLADIIAGTYPKRHHRINPATKTFQALRIAVNDELGVLETLLQDGFNLLAPGGRMAIISFHSLEDRIVKRFFREKAHDQLGVLITKKPITPSDEEQAENPRARSAKLRIIEKL